MEKVILKVEGMSCMHCENAVKNSVGELEGVSSVVVDLKGKTATVEYETSQVTLENIKNAIEDQGYDVI